ncbi:hypothetical protein PORY_002420 [Pneumocystis oryctolagi]|uniref:Uncharacterized protein n=1 Tax=Pneumocystis oryctolagi TaxID=42067 RepID=A0ACB7C970_9ASCO|nr:hypothetical protein PORY_002420 [Pneumocystis oryctolagi]
MSFVSMRYQIICFFFFICIHANVEKVVFTATLEASQKPFLSSLKTPPTLSSLLLLGEPFALQTQLGYDENQTAIITSNWFHAPLSIGTVYEVRVCWPATSPALIDISVFYEADAVSFSDKIVTFYVQISCKAAYFSLNSSVMNTHILPLHITLDKVIYGIPWTLRWVLLYGFAVGLIAWFYLGPFIYWIINRQVKKE